jgi:hypothetical protein
MHSDPNYGEDLREMLYVVGNLVAKQASTSLEETVNHHIAEDTSS